MEISYTRSFLRMLKSLPNALKEEAIEKIDLFRDPQNHAQLKVHKLHGRLAGRFSFSVNYKIRIIFTYIPGQGSQKEALLHAVDDHDVYDR